MTTIAIARAEVQQRRLFLQVAAAMGAISALARLTPAPQGDPTWGTSVYVFGLMVAGIGIVALPSAIALGLGSSMIGREVGERRLGFWFARPVPAWQIWGGKLLAAVVVVAGSYALVAIPNLLPDQFQGLAARHDRVLDIVVDTGRAMGLIALGCFSVMSVLALATRTRSPLVFVDALVAAIGAASVGWVGWVFLAGGQPDVFTRAVVPMLVKGVFAFVGTVPLLAILAYLQLGRLDAARGHAAMSAVLATCTLTAAAGLLALERRTHLAAPADLVRDQAMWASTSPSGSLAVVGGHTTWGPWRLPSEPMFLVDLESGRWERLGESPSAIQWSPDGRSLLYFRNQGTLVRAALDTRGVAVERFDWPGADALPRAEEIRYVWARSASGRLLAVRETSQVVLVATDAWRTLGRAPLEGQCSGAFRGEVLRTACASPARGGVVHVTVTDVAEDDRRQVSRLDRTGSMCWPRLSADGERLLLSCTQGGHGEGTLELMASDGIGVRLLRDGDVSNAARLRADGRVLARSWTGNGLTIYALDGTEERRVELPQGGWSWTDAGPEAIVTRLPPNSWRVNVATGAIREDDLWPLEGDARLFLAPDGSVVLREPGSEARRVVLAAPQ